MIFLTGLGHGNILGMVNGGVMSSRIPAVRMKSRFYRFLVGDAAFCVYDQLVILEA